MTSGSKLLEVARWAERRIGTKRAAPHYYSLVYRFAPRLGVSCFNFGYADSALADLPEGPEPYQLELYRQVALAAGRDVLRGGCVLEISSGLGGGLAFVAKTFAPRLCVALERAMPAVSSARRRLGLIAVQGDAEDLRLPDAAFDVVLNVEASHVYYGPAFLAEVARVLRRGGIFAIADSRSMSPAAAEQWLRDDFEQSGLALRSFRDITSNVAAACELDDPRREAILAKLPYPLRGLLRTMLGGVTTPNYAQLKTGRGVYFIATAERQ